MSLLLPYTLADGAGNKPSAEKWNSNYWYMLAILIGNFIKNAGMEIWTTTSFSNPATGASIVDNWTWRKSGTSSPSVDVSREATIIDSGTYSGKANITVAGSSNSLAAFDQVIVGYPRIVGGTVVFGASVRTSSASKVRLKVSDGVGVAQYSTYHTGGGTFEVLRVSMAIASSSVAVTVSIEITSDFTGAVYVDSTFLYLAPSDISTVGITNLSYLALAENSPYTGNGSLAVAPNGQTYRISVDNDGAITSERLT